MRALGDQLPPARQQTQTILSTAHRDLVATPEFVNRLHEMSIQRLGYDPGQPIVNVYLRGTRQAVKQGPGAGNVEVVIVAKSPDKQHIGLTLKEIEDVWMEYGTSQLGAVDLYGTQMGVDGINGRLLFGDLDNAPRMQGAAGEMVGFDGTGIPGAKVVFADVFEPGDQVWSALSGYGDGIIDPVSIRTQTYGGGSASPAYVRNYETSQGKWQWSRKPNENYMEAIQDIDGWQPGFMEDARLRDIWAYAKGEGADRAWHLDLKMGDGTKQALKRAWYLDEIPDNVTLVDVDTAEVLTNEWFQTQFGAPEELLTLNRPRGLEDVIGTPENVQQVFLRDVAQRLGLTEDDILSGDLNSILKKTDPAKLDSGLVDFLKNIMDPIPYKERAMTRMAMKEANEIMVGVLEATDQQALKMFRDMGVPDHEICLLYTSPSPRD